jgi:hypothetical protein
VSDKQNDKRVAAAMKAACKSMYDQIRSDWGRGWIKLGDSLKHAIIAERVLAVFISGPPDETVKAGVMQMYIQAMRDYCGLGELDAENINR